MKTGNSLSDSLSYYFRCIIIFEPVFVEVRTAWIRMVRFGDPTPELAVDLHDVYLLDGMRDGDRNFIPHTKLSVLQYLISVRIAACLAGV